MMQAYLASLSAYQTRDVTVGAPTVEAGSCSSGGLWHTAKRDSTGYCSSMGYYSSSLHRLLFNQPSMGSCSSSLHRLLFNQPSTGSCSTSPPRGPVQPALHVWGPSTGYCSSTPTSSIGVLFIKRQRPLLPRDPVHSTPIGNCSSRGSFDRLQLAAVAKETLGFS